MCLWRVATLSRILLLHMALSSWQPPKQSQQRQPNASRSDRNYLIHVAAHSANPQHSFTATTRTTTTTTTNYHNPENSYFGRPRSNNDCRQTLGRITLPPISPLSLIQRFLFAAQKKSLPLQQPNRKRRSFPPNMDDDELIVSDHHYWMATSAVTDNDDEKVDAAVFTTLPSEPSSSSSSFLLENENDDDNSDIFYRNDDDYYCYESSPSSSSSSNHPLYCSNRRIATSDGPKTRKRTMWWTMDQNNDNVNEPRQEQEQQNGVVAHTHPSFDDTVQQVIRIKVQKPTGRVQHGNVATTSGEDHQQQYIESLTQPLMTESVWNQLTGTEWCGSHNNVENAATAAATHDQLLDSLAKMGESVARIDTPTQWIDWHLSGSSSSSSDDDDDVQVWTGKCIATPPPPPSFQKAETDDDQHHSGSNDVVEEKYLGIQLPFIKTRAILPYSVADVVDLLLDSKKVITYNPWSLGRKDCWIDTSGSSGTDTTTKISMTTKIVQNRVQPPIPGARQVVSTTLLHARPIQSTLENSEFSNDPTTTSWIIVSRSVGKNHIYNDEVDQKAKTSRSDILLGVNLLEPVRSKDGTIVNVNQCRLTAVTHVYSPSVPTAFAERLGVQSSIKFIQDIRNLKHKSTLPTATEKVPEPANVTN